MRYFNTSGTLGDSYVISCKLKDVQDKITLYHYTSHADIFEGIIRKIFNLVPNIVEVKIHNVKKEIYKKEYKKVKSKCKKFPSEPEDIKMNFFPGFEFESELNYDFPYLVLQPKSGREEQDKEIPLSLVNKIIQNNNYKVVLIGTSKKYANVKNCINLIGKTSLFDSFHLIKNAKYFIGFFGIMTMVALSNRVNSNFIYINEEELENRVYGNPWERYCKNIISLENFKRQRLLLYRVKKIFIELFHKLLPEKIIKQFNVLKKKIRLFLGI